MVALNQVHGHVDSKSGGPNSALGSKERQDRSSHSVVRCLGSPMLIQPFHGLPKRGEIKLLTYKVIATRTHSPKQDVVILACGTRDQRRFTPKEFLNIGRGNNGLVNVLVEVNDGDARAS